MGGVLSTFLGGFESHSEYWDPLIQLLLDNLRKQSCSSSFLFALYTSSAQSGIQVQAEWLAYSVSH